MLLFAPRLVAQSSRVTEAESRAMAAFGAEFQRAVLQARGGRPSDLAAANKGLERALALVQELPAAQRAQAEFGVLVRRAQLYQRAGKAERAAETVLEAMRRFALEEQVWQGSHRAIALVVLWASLPLDEFLAKVPPGDRAFLLSDAASRYENELVGALALARADLLLLAPGSEAQGLALLQRTWEDLRARAQGAEGDAYAAWRVAAAQRLFAFHFERREFERARPWLDELPEALVHAPRSKLALELSDYATAEAEARFAAQGDPLWWAQVGDALEAQGRYADALAAYRTCLAAAQDPVDLAAAKNGEGDALAGLRGGAPGLAADAKASYEAGLAALRGIAGPRALGELAECEKDLGRLHEQAGDLAHAERHFRAALAAIASARAALPMDVLGDAYLGDAALLAVDGLLRLGARQGSSPFESLAVIESMRARGLLDWMTAPPRKAAFEEMRMRVAAVLLAGTSAATGERLRALERERARLGVAARPESPPLAPDTLRGLVASEPETLFVVTWLDRERGAERAKNRARLFAFLGERSLALDLGTRGRAERLARAAIEAVAAPVGDPWPALREASAFWLRPELVELVRRARKVVLCVDPADARLPFEAFPCDGEPLGAKVALERAPSLTVWRLLRGRTAKSSRSVVVDSVPHANESEALGVAPLRFSAREGELVATTLGTTQRLSGPRAALGDLRATLGDAAVDVLHLSAHAVAHPSLPSAASLLLADGPVPFSAFADLPLQGALVVLSACSSGSGAARGGEGVVGLLWGPLAAGARGVVASIYEVNQQATSDLMATFHAERERGCNVLEALRRARARLAASANYAHPHYWAGFASFGADSADLTLFAGRETPLWCAALCLLCGSALLARSRRITAKAAGPRRS